MPGTSSTHFCVPREFELSLLAKSACLLVPFLLGYGTNRNPRARKVHPGHVTEGLVKPRDVAERLRHPRNESKGLSSMLAGFV